MGSRNGGFCLATRGSRGNREDKALRWNPVIDVGVELVFDDHPFGVAGEQVCCWGGEVVGDQQGGLVMADDADRDLT